MVKAITASNVNIAVSYQMADGSQIPHRGERQFIACTEDGSFRHFTAQEAEVNKTLHTVSKMVAVGNTVVFDSEGCYVEHGESREWIPLAERDGVYTLKMWVPKHQQIPLF